MELHIEIALIEQDSSENIELRWSIEDFIMEQDLGEIIDAGIGQSVMDIFIEVDDVTAAMKTIQRFSKEHMLQDRLTIKPVEV